MRSQALLRQCRAIALDRMPELIGGALERVVMDLRSGLVSDLPAVDSWILKAMPDRLRMLRPRVMKAFATAFEAALSEPAKDADNPMPPEALSLEQPGEVDGRLKLVDEDFLEDILIASETVRRTQNALEREMDAKAETYWGMRLRVAQLTGSTDYSERGNPFSVRLISDALVKATQEILTDSIERKALLRCIQPAFAEAVLECYREINEFLLKEQVLPSIVSAIHYLMSHGKQIGNYAGGSEAVATDPDLASNPMLQTLLRQDGNPLARQWARALGNASGEAQRAQGGEGGPLSFRTQRADAVPGAAWSGAGALSPVAAMAAAGMADGAARQGAAGGIPHTTGQRAGQSIGVPDDGGGTLTAPVSFSASYTPSLPPGFVQAFVPGFSKLLMDFLAQAAQGSKSDHQQVARMLAEPQEHLFDPALAMPPSPGLIDALDARQHEASQLAAPLEAHFGYGDALKAQAHPLDALTAEFVGSIFESMVSEHAISEAARQEIARLQPAALKAAVLDRTFFASRAHPMRRLLDRITQVARDPGIDSSDGSEFVRELGDVVAELNEIFTDDVGIIDAMVERVDDIALRYAGTAHQEEVIDTRVLERSERELIASATTTTELERRIPSHAPAFVQDFLRRWWKRALIEAYVDDKKDEESWHHRLETVDQLIWSVGPGFAAQLPRLRRILPLMVRTLILGMKDAGMPEAHRDAFLDALMNVHRHMVAQWREANEAAAAAQLSQTQGVAPGVASPGVSPGRDPDASGAVSPNASAGGETGEGQSPAGETASGAEASAGYSRAYCERLVDSLSEGAILEFIASDVAGNAVWQPLRLSWLSPQRMIFLFTARLTRARQLSRASLIESLETGTARLVEEGSSYLDRTIAAVAGS
jgi:hypothetical protein